MNVWEQYIGKKIFVRTKNNRTYAGKVLLIDSSDPTLTFISLLDIKGNNVTLVHSEIVEIKEEQ